MKQPKSRAQIATQLSLDDIQDPSEAEAQAHVLMKETPNRKTWIFPQTPQNWKLMCKKLEEWD